jgi:nucleoid-associated protein YgaU
MQIPDPIRPYADLIRWGLVALLAGGLFVAGCQRGEDRQAAADREQVESVQRQLDGARAEAAENLRAANAAGELLQEVNRQTQASIDAAEAARKASDAAARRAEAAAVEGQRRATAAEKALQAAKTQPACRAQLEQILCDSIPLL